MKSMKLLIKINLFTYLLFASLSIFASNNAYQNATWETVLKKTLSTYGDRNWIVVTDSAYPMQSSANITVLNTQANQEKVLKQVLLDIAVEKQIRPEIYSDFELKYVPEKLAPGITEFRHKLAKILSPYIVHSTLHINNIRKLNVESKKYQVLLLKTNSLLPYTSLFIKLKAGYWTDTDENTLRKIIQNK